MRLRLLLLHDIISIFLFFLLVNSFYIIPPINSSMIVLVIAVFFAILYNQKFLTDFKWLMLNQKIILIYAIIIFLISVNLSITLLHGTVDLSYSKNFISQLIQLTIIVFTTSFIFRIYDNSIISYSQYAERLIVLIFVIQSVVELLAFFSPEFASLVHLTYKPEQIEQLYNNASYSGDREISIRGLALTASPGWGLAVGYGFAFLFYVKHYLLNKPLNIKMLTIGLLLIIGTFFAGRTGFVGAILGLIYYLIASGSLFVKIKNIFYGISILLIGLSIVYFTFTDIAELFINKVFPFVFEMYFQYESTGTASSKSTDVLAKMWTIPISEQVYLYGSGLFTDPSTGSYYRHVDIGYLRNILFGGIFWMLLIVLYNSYIGGVIFILNKKVDFDTKTFIVFLLLYTMVLEAKAMTLAFNKYAFTIFIFYFIALLYDIKQKEKSK